MISITWLVVLIVVILLVAAVGWYIWKHFTTNCVSKEVNLQTYEVDCNKHNWDLDVIPVQHGRHVLDSTLPLNCGCDECEAPKVNLVSQYANTAKYGGCETDGDRKNKSPSILMPPPPPPPQPRPPPQQRPSIKTPQPTPSQPTPTPQPQPIEEINMEIEIIEPAPLKRRPNIENPFNFSNSNMNINEAITPIVQTAAPTANTPIKNVPLTAVSPTPLPKPIQPITAAVTVVTNSNNNNNNNTKPAKLSQPVMNEPMTPIVSPTIKRRNK